MTAEGKRPKDSGESSRAVRLDRIRARCEEGTYAVASKKVADKIVDDTVVRIRKRRK